MEADSVAVDPHKWLFAPLEVGCALVRDPKALHDTFSYRPQYYHLVEDPADKRISGSEGVVVPASGRPRGLQTNDRR